MGDVSCLASWCTPACSDHGEAHAARHRMTCRAACAGRSCTNCCTFSLCKCWRERFLGARTRAHGHQMSEIWGVAGVLSNCAQYQAKYSEMHGPRNQNVHAPSQVCVCFCVCFCWSVMQKRSAYNSKSAVRVNHNAVAAERAPTLYITLVHLLLLLAPSIFFFAHMLVFAGGVCRGPC